MNVLTAVRAGVRAPLRRPFEVLPFYLLMFGAVAAARVPLFLALGLALLLLVEQNRIEPVVRELQGIDWTSVGENATLSPGLEQAIAGLVTPGTLALGLLGVVAFICAAVLARSVAAAGTHSVLYSALEGGSVDVARTGNDAGAARDGAAGIARYWQQFLVLGIVRGLFVGGAVLLGFLGLVFTATLYGAIIGIPLLLVAMAVGCPATLLLAFAGTAVVVEGTGALDALRRSVGFPFREPAAFLLYAVLLVGVSVGLVILGAGFEYLGIPRLAALLSMLVVFPLLDSIKVALYAGDDLPESGTVPLDVEAIPGRARVGVMQGLQSLGGFLRAHPLANLAGLATMLLGVALGWVTTAPYGTRLNPPPDIAGTFGQVPVGPFLNIAANNWLVAAGGSYGGLALGIPSAASLLFNGILVGALAGVFDTSAFLALVGPHGLLEVPALSVGGGLGYHLGHVGWNALRGRCSAAVVGVELRRAFRVLVGLAPVFVLAAFIEAFVTPHVAAAVAG